ncbi:MAG TPA: sulfatase-like hydrolase/transferase [Verrucomicrobiales bacterium]|nr:sulfatase-like hydrolase/transferase [Verrucomicrobiales bacterium]
MITLPIAVPGKSIASSRSTRSLALRTVLSLAWFLGAAVSGEAASASPARGASAQPGKAAPAPPAHAGSAQPKKAAAAPPPNILFIILDDVGVDQLRIFNPHAVQAAETPNMDAVAAAGLQFNRFTTMPECSPSRAAFFTGRYPLRTGVKSAILEQDLPQSQVSPYEATTPKVLRRGGYSSALFGKFHLGGPTLNPDSHGTPAALGWDYFDGIRKAPLQPSTQRLAASGPRMIPPMAGVSRWATRRAWPGSRTRTGRSAAMTTMARVIPANRP